ncbi:hypothetical protein DL96DRAFT_1821335 [Flagelloscypha sp. PMI_526]|nr:hypothetical protein DL96DRAFT_1821335 [Flagelloscypha sp. PMI_526]
MGGAATATLTSTSNNLTVVALHTLNPSQASVSILWNTHSTTELDHYVVGETNAAGKFRLDRPLETWYPLHNTFFEPGATGSSADRLECQDQHDKTPKPTATTSLGYAVQECAKVHIYNDNFGTHSTITGSVTITPRPVKTIVNVTTTTLYKKGLSTKTKLIIGFSVTFGVIVIALWNMYCRPSYYIVARV